MMWHVARPRVLAAFAAAVLLLLGGCSTLVPVPPASVPRVTLSEAELGYARVLQRHVNDLGEVDFAALRDDASGSGMPALANYLAAIADTPLTAAPNDAARLAHMINAYNALSMYNVIASNIPRSHEGWAKVDFFVLRRFDIGGSALSLYAFENDIIRKLNDPRVHFALNCSAVSCPRLPRTPFTGENLSDELDRETRLFFALPSNLRVDSVARIVYFNEILKFYSEDFTPAHATSLIAYAQQYVAQQLPSGYTVAFTPYDWTIANSRR